MNSCSRRVFRQQGVTMVEVLAAALLILLSLSGILAMNARSLHILRSTRQAVSSSQMLQQRIEAMRNRPWPEISSATALAALLRVPPESEKEFTDTAFTEFISVSVPAALGSEDPTARSFSLQRKDGVVQVNVDGDLGTESMLLVNVSLQWRDSRGPHQRMLRTVLCRSGLTRNGVFGSALGRPPTPGSSP